MFIVKGALKAHIRKVRVIICTNKERTTININLPVLDH